MKALALAALILAAAALTVAIIGLKRPRPSPPERLVLTDAEGRERVRVSVGEEGGTIEILDDQGSRRAHLTQMGLKVDASGERKSFAFLGIAADTQSGLMRLRTPVVEVDLSASELDSGLSVDRGHEYRADLTLGEHGGGLRVGQFSGGRGVELRYHVLSDGPSAGLSINGSGNADQEISLWSKQNLAAIFAARKQIASSEAP